MRRGPASGSWATSKLVVGTEAIQDTPAYPKDQSFRRPEMTGEAEKSVRVSKKGGNASKTVSGLAGRMHPQA
jgi:hypothetical protein